MVKTCHLRVLNIEDDVGDFELLVRKLKREGYEVQATRVENSIELVDSLQENPWDVILSDNNLPKFNAFDALELSKKYQSTVPFIILSGTIKEDEAVQAMKLGAHDYIMKSNWSRLLPAIERELLAAKNQNESQKALNEQDGKYKMLANSIQDIFFAINPKLKIMYWNRASEKVTGINEEKALDQHLLDVFYLLKGTLVEERIYEALLSEQDQHFEFLLDTLKQVRYYDAHIYPYNGGLSVFIRDVTSRKKVYRRLIESNRELETFMYKVSHELKGPAASIRGVLNIAEYEVQDEAAKELMKHLSKCTDNLETTLNRLLHVTRVKQGQVENELIHLKKMIFQIREDLELHPEYENVEFRFENIDQTLTCDFELLRSVLNNILENALKYRNTKRGDSYIHVKAFENNGSLNIAIADNGIGIKQEYQHNIFEMFIRANEMATGSGLGLYIVKNAVEKLSGRIHLTSELDQGSTFTLQLPIHSSDSFG